MKRAFLFSALLLAAVPAAAQDAAQAVADRVYELVDVETLPRPANAAELVAALQAGYPADLRAGGVEGTVQVSMIVGADGTVSQPSVVRSTHAGFDSATVAAVGMLRFEPARVGGRPVRARVELPIQWRLAPPAPVEATAAAAAPSPGVVIRPVADSVRVYELSDVDVQPRPRNVHTLQDELERRYPPDLRDAETQGTVQVRFRIDRQGNTHDFIVRHSTEPRLNEPTIEALRLLRFTPARENGEAVHVWVELPIQWQVSDRPAAAREAPRLDPPPAGRAVEGRRP